MAGPQASLHTGWKEGPSEEVTFELRPEECCLGPVGLAPLPLELPAQAQLPQGGVSC